FAMDDAEVRAAPILVVDDDPKIVTLVRTYLEREGFSVVTAGDGRAALAAVGESKPRLIVLDIMLPELDGLALMRILREQAEGRVLSRQALLDALYGPVQGDALERTIDVHVGRLRDKLGEDVDRPRYIATVRGAGYRAVDE